MNLRYIPHIRPKQWVIVMAMVMVVVMAMADLIIHTLTQLNP